MPAYLFWMGRAEEKFMELENEGPKRSEER